MRGDPQLQPYASSFSSGTQHTIATAQLTHSSYVDERVVIRKQPQRDNSHLNDKKHKCLGNSKSYDGLVRLLNSMNYPNNVRDAQSLEMLNRGAPLQHLSLLRFALVEYNALLCQHIQNKGYIIDTPDNRSFIENVLRLHREYPIQGFKKWKRLKSIKPDAFLRLDYKAHRKLTFTVACVFWAKVKGKELDGHVAASSETIDDHHAPLQAVAEAPDVAASSETIDDNHAPLQAVAEAQDVAASSEMIDDNDAPLQAAAEVPDVAASSEMIHDNDAPLQAVAEDGHVAIANSLPQRKLPFINDTPLQLCSPLSRRQREDEEKASEQDITPMFGSLRQRDCDQEGDDNGDADIHEDDDWPFAPSIFMNVTRPPSHGSISVSVSVFTAECIDMSRFLDDDFLPETIDATRLLYWRAASKLCLQLGNVHGWAGIMCVHSDNLQIIDDTNRALMWRIDGSIHSWLPARALISVVIRTQEQWEPLSKQCRNKLGVQQCDKMADLLDWRQCDNQISSNIQDIVLNDTTDEKEVAAAVFYDLTPLMTCPQQIFRWYLHAFNQCTAQCSVKRDEHGFPLDDAATLLHKVGEMQQSLDSLTQLRNDMRQNVLFHITALCGPRDDVSMHCSVTPHSEVKQLILVVMRVQELLRIEFTRVRYVLRIISIANIIVQCTLFRETVRMCQQFQHTQGQPAYYVDVQQFAQQRIKKAQRDIESLEERWLLQSKLLRRSGDFIDDQDDEREAWTGYDCEQVRYRGGYGFSGFDARYRQRDRFRDRYVNGLWKWESQKAKQAAGRRVAPAKLVPPHWLWFHPRLGPKDLRLSCRRAALTPFGLEFGWWSDNGNIQGFVCWQIRDESGRPHTVFVQHGGGSGREADGFFMIAPTALRTQYDYYPQHHAFAGHSVYGPEECLDIFTCSNRECPNFYVFQPENRVACFLCGCRKPKPTAKNAFELYDRRRVIKQAPLSVQWREYASERERHRSSQHQRDIDMLIHLCVTQPDDLLREWTLSAATRGVQEYAHELNVLLRAKMCQQYEGEHEILFRSAMEHVTDACRSLPPESPCNQVRPVEIDYDPPEFRPPTTDEEEDDEDEKGESDEGDESEWSQCA